MKLFKTILFIITLTVILSFCFSLSVLAAEKPPEPPVLQYKLVNHDKISLKWDAVEGADKYYIYRQNPVSGKFNLRYSAVTETTATIGKLEAETEYSFAVTAVKTVDGKEIKSGLSNKVIPRTPPEWFTEKRIEKDDKAENRYVLFAHHYDGGNEVKIDESDYFITSVLYYNDFVYYVRLNSNEEINYKVNPHSAGNLYRMNMNTMEKELIMDMGDIVDTFAGYNDKIYICSDRWIPLGSKKTIIYTLLDDYTGVKKVFEDKNSLEFLTINDMDGTYNFSKDGKIYFKSYQMEPVNYRYSRDIYTIFRMNYDGTGYEQISDQKFSRDKHNNIITIKDDYLYYTHIENIDDDIYRLIRKDLKTDEDELIYESTLPLYALEEKNGYFYLDSNSYYSNGELARKGFYYRMKLDGSELTRSETPFEWRY